MKFRNVKIINDGIWIPKDEIVRLYNRYTLWEDSTIQEFKIKGDTKLLLPMREFAALRHCFQEMLQLIIKGKTKNL